MSLLLDRPAFLLDEGGPEDSDGSVVRDEISEVKNKTAKLVRLARSMSPEQKAELGAVLGRIRLFSAT
jgi:hypothetical protein